MLKAYFDDSGRGQDPVFVLAGFLSTAGRWAAFNEDWRNELDREPTLGRFKMQHAMTGSDRWRLIREDARLERLDLFRSIIHRHVLFGFVCVVRHDDYNRLMRERLNFPDTAYWFGFMGAIGATMR